MLATSIATGEWKVKEVDGALLCSDHIPISACYHGNMLISHDQLDSPVGIAVSQWQVKGKRRIFTLIPFAHDSERYVEVDCIIEENSDLKIISKPLEGWSPIKNGFGDKAEGYQYDEQTAKNLYKVWDDGAGKEFNAAKELYKTFENLIDHYSEEANEYLDELSNETYEAATKHAKQRGWDVSSIQTQKVIFPYKSPLY